MDEHVYYFHGQLADKTRYTIAGAYDSNGLKLGFAICSEKDQFCKKTGRIKAKGKLLSASDFGNDYEGMSPEEGHEAREFVAHCAMLVDSEANYSRAELKEVFNLVYHGEGTSVV